MAGWRFPIEQCYPPTWIPLTCVGHLANGQHMCVPEGGSQWGGLFRTEGRSNRRKSHAWCYNPSYFAPGHHYLPKHLDGTPRHCRRWLQLLIRQSLRVAPSSTTLLVPQALWETGCHANGPLIEPEQQIDPSGDHEEITQYLQLQVLLLTRKYGVLVLKAVAGLLRCF